MTNSISKFESVLKSSAHIKTLCQDDDFAYDLYAGLCNIEYHLKDNILERSLVSWRGSARLVAEIRDVGETYLDFYCSRMIGEDVQEGILTDAVRNALAEIGYIPFESQVLSNLGEYDKSKEYFILECTETIEREFALDSDQEARTLKLQRLAEYKSS